MKFFFRGAILSFLFTISFAFAFEIPVNKNQTVLDQADIFSASSEQNLRQIIAKIEEETTAEIVVWTVPTLDGYPIFNAALEAGRKWGVGQEDNSNGLVLLIAVEDRDWFMVSGYGVEGVLPDVVIKRIGERHFPDNFRQNHYDRGVQLALLELQNLLKSDPEVIAQYAKNPRDQYWGMHVFFAFALFCFSVYRKRDNLVTGIFFSSIFILQFLVLGSTVLASGGILAYLLVSIFYFFIALSPGTSNGGGSSFSGGGGWSSGGGFSSGGFGGGSFGGGGSGGSW